MKLERKRKVRDLTGQKFGKLTVLYKAPNYISPSGSQRSMWHCRCECGKEKDIRADGLLSGSTQSCGYCGLEGQRFGKLTVMYRVKDQVAPSGRHRVMWHCRCDCGNEKDITSNSLKRGNASSCGCYAKELSSSKFEDLTGQRFGHLLVVKKAPSKVSSYGNTTRWECICDCGKKKIVNAAGLKSGSTTSCGCAKTKKWDMIGSECMNINGIYMICYDYTSVEKIEVIFEDGERRKCGSKYFQKNKVMHPAFSSPTTAKEFHEYKNLRFAFRIDNDFYYSCITPDGESDILPISSMILEDQKRKYKELKGKLQNVQGKI